MLSRPQKPCFPGPLYWEKQTRCTLKIQIFELTNLKSNLASWLNIAHHKGFSKGLHVRIPDSRPSLVMALQEINLFKLFPTIHFLSWEAKVILTFSDHWRKGKGRNEKALDPTFCAHLFSTEMALHCAKLHSQPVVSSTGLQQPGQEGICVRGSVLQLQCLYLHTLLVYWSAPAGALCPALVNSQTEREIQWSE